MFALERTVLSPTSVEQFKKFAGMFSIPVNVKVYPEKSPKAVPLEIVPAVTSIPLSAPARKN